MKLFIAALLLFAASSVAADGGNPLATIGESLLENLVSTIFNIFGPLLQLISGILSDLLGGLPDILAGGSS